MSDTITKVKMTTSLGDIIIAVNNALGYLGTFEQMYKNPFIIYPIYFS